MAVVSLQGIGHLLWVPAIASGCYLSARTNVLPISLAHTAQPANPWLERTAGQRRWPVPFALRASAAAQPQRYAA